jgi:zinc protease
LATGETVDMVRDWPEEIRGVTAAAVRDAARTWLNRGASVTGYLVNSVQSEEKHS